jgi:hypothetical protein
MALSSQGKSTMPPALWPSKAKRQGIRAIVAYTARFLQIRGFWPRRKELTEFMRTETYAVSWYIDEDIKLGLMEWQGRIPRRELMITERGWKYLGLQPFMPRTRRPNQARVIRDRMTAKVVREVLTELAAERNENNG